MNQLRLLISGNDTLALQGLARIFIAEKKFEVLDAVPVAEIGEKAAELQPDAILFDLSGDLNSFEFVINEINEINRSCPCCRVLVLTDQEHSEEILPLMNQGVDGCIPQGISRKCLINAVVLACDAQMVCLPQFLKKTVFSSSLSATASRTTQRNSFKTKNGQSLTNRELEILQLMGKNLSNREIGKELFISEPTVKTHVSHILRKLGQTSRAQAIIYSYEKGLLG